MGVVHFGDLAELVEELPAGYTVRVAVLDVSEGVSRDGVRLAGLGVHVRAFDPDGHVLACYVPVACLQMVGKTVLSDPGGTEGAYDAAWTRAEAKADQVREYLAGRGYDVRPGVIDLGEVRPLRGVWSEDKVEGGSL